MDVRPLLRLVAIAVLVLATALGLRAIRRWPARRTSGLVAGTLAVLALAGFALSTLDLLAPHAPVPDALSVYYSLSARKPLGLSQGMNGVLTCRFLA